MQTTLARILKHGIPTAVILAVIGFFMAEFAGEWINTQPNAHPNDIPGVSAEAVAKQMKTRLPITMAAWGFVIVLVYEMIAAMWRQNTPVQRPAGLPKESEVELLLNQLLARAEADKAARERAGQGGTRRSDSATESHSELDLGN